MSDSHIFIDAAGQAQQGRETLVDRWEAFLRVFPTFEIELGDMLADDRTIAALGWVKFREPSGATVSIPAAWRVVVESGLITVWQVYCDIEPMLRAHGMERWPARG